MTPIAHAGHWIGSVVYLGPLIAFGLYLLVSRARDKRRGARGDLPVSMLFIAALAAAGLGSAAASEPALAHGIHESAAGKSVLEFVPLGIEHMLLGWDHLLFIIGVVILSGNLRRAAKLVSLFVAGHSLTLLVATIAGWKLNATAVDAVIALSLVYVGVQGIRSQRETPEGEKKPIFTNRGPERSANWTAIGVTIFGFGLIHGLGLSTRLQDLGLPDDGMVWRVIAFNVGIEIGQLLVLTAVVAIGYFVLPMVDWPKVRRVAYAGLTITGLIAAAALSFSGASEEESNAVSAPAQATASCMESETNLPGTLAGGHPAKRFYGPEEEAPKTDLEHVIGDGYVVVRYRPDLPAGDRQAIADWVEQTEQGIAAAHPEQEEALTATAAYRKIACPRFDMRALTVFGDKWFADVKAGRFR
jgi:hypothetical protein